MVFKENKKVLGALSGPMVAEKGVGLDRVPITGSVHWTPKILRGQQKSQAR